MSAKVPIAVFRWTCRPRLGTISAHVPFSKRCQATTNFSTQSRRLARPRENVYSTNVPRNRRHVWYRAAGGAILVAIGGALQFHVNAADGRLALLANGYTTLEDTDKSQEDVESKNRYIRIHELKKHDGNSEHPWVARGESVYDITDWVAAHPGGEIILRAAGGSIDPYWDIFTIHKKQYIYDILDQYYIGKIDPVDLVDGKFPVGEIEDPFAHDPVRDPRLKTLTARPRCAETQGDSLGSFLTENGTFYVRNHMWVPRLDDSNYTLTVELPNGDEKCYTLQALRDRFEQHKVTVTLQCAGNRRKDMTDHAKQTNGLQWTVGAISTAEWEGVLLRDLLQDAGIDTSKVLYDREVRHAQFVGDEAYGGSIPIEKAVDPLGDVILALRMNGEELPADHGYPVRVVVPGTVAARSVKWLRRVILSDEESPSQWQRRDYKCFGPNVSNPDWSKGKSIQEMPVTSAITGISTIRREARDPEEIMVEGYAYSGGGRDIVRVDISLDNGKTWDQAELLENSAKGSKNWSWKQWKYKTACINKETAQVVVKATDESYNTQPESYKAIYNPRGNLATAWHRVSYSSKD